jgi:Mitochondrial branched-chain alpha-ketoacid dehydrogenase kinase
MTPSSPQWVPPTPPPKPPTVANSRLAQGILEYKKHRQRSQIDSQIQSFLDRFYMSRIGIRMLIGQHIALNNEPSRPDYVGIICTRTNVQALSQEAIDNARFICEDYYGLFDAPKVQLICRPDLEFMYVPGYDLPPQIPPPLLIHPPLLCIYVLWCVMSFLVYLYQSFFLLKE